MHVELVMLLVAVGISIATTVVVLRRTRDAGWVRDAQLTMNASPGWTVVSLVFHGLGAAAGFVIGAVFISGGHPAAGWVFLCFGGMLGVLVGVQIWVARRPFPADPPVDGPGH